MEVCVEVTLNIEPRGIADDGTPITFGMEDAIPSAVMAVRNAVSFLEGDNIHHTLEDMSSIKVVNVKPITHRRPV